MFEQKRKVYQRRVGAISEERPRAALRDVPRLARASRRLTSTGGTLRAASDCSRSCSGPGETAQYPRPTLACPLDCSTVCTSPGRHSARVGAAGEQRPGPRSVWRATGPASAKAASSAPRRRRRCHRNLCRHRRRHRQTHRLPSCWCRHRPSLRPSAVTCPWSTCRVLSTSSIANQCPARCRRLKGMRPRSAGSCVPSRTHAPSFRKYRKSRVIR